MSNCILMDGKALSNKIRENIKNEVQRIKKDSNLVPGLAVIMVGDDPASEIYVRNKEKACEQVGFYSKCLKLPADISEDDLIGYIEELNKDENIDGILCQLPLPKSIDTKRVLSKINSDKDVDVFKSNNMGKLLLGETSIAPCTPSGIVALLDEYNIDIKGKHCVIVGRSNIVGKPLAMLMLQHDASVTICHSKTEGLKEICKTADILVSAVGKKDLITVDMVKEGAVVIDVGINRDENGKVCGDVSKDVMGVASYMTPVPGGVGPMTITMLLRNTLELFKMNTVDFLK